MCLILAKLDSNFRSDTLVVNCFALAPGSPKCGCWRRCWSSCIKSMCPGVRTLAKWALQIKHQQKLLEEFPYSLAIVAIHWTTKGKFDCSSHEIWFDKFSHPLEQFVQKGPKAIIIRNNDLHCCNPYWNTLSKQSQNNIDNDLFSNLPLEHFVQTVRK